MKIFSKIKSKKTFTIIFVVCAVVISSLITGVVTVKTRVISEKLYKDADTMSAKVETTVIKSTEISTAKITANASKSTSAKKYSFNLSKKEIAVKKGNTYSIELADGMKKSDLNLSWSSDNKKIATVDKNGIVKGISKGSTVIICTNDEDKTSAKLKVNVSEPVYPDDITLDKESYLLTSIGQPLKLNAKITPEKNVTETKLVWKTDDESVATVKDGLVKSVGEGTAVISCTTANDLVAYCEITVKPVVKVEEIYVDYEAYDFNGPQTESVLLTAIVYPENATNKKVSWHSTNENIAMVDTDGNVTIVGDGECDIVCTTTDGTYLSSTCKITSANTMAIVRHTPGTSVYVPVNPVPADTVLEEALRYVGIIPYVWGGTDLSSGVDCSGFICAVYERFGINLWGVRTDLYLAGVEVASIEQAKAGDILCYPGHVAIYDGNGGRVHAYDEGYMILRDTNIGGYYTIRRIIE